MFSHGQNAFNPELLRRPEVIRRLTENALSGIAVDYIMTATKLYILAKEKKNVVVLYC